MIPKKKRTYYFIVDEDLEVMGLYETREEAKNSLTFSKVGFSLNKFKFKVLRVTLTASPAGWK